MTLINNSLLSLTIKINTYKTPNNQQQFDHYLQPKTSYTSPYNPYSYTEPTLEPNFNFQAAQEQLHFYPTESFTLIHPNNKISTTSPLTQHPKIQHEQTSIS